MDFSIYGTDESSEFDGVYSQQMMNNTPDDNCVFCGDKVGLVDYDHVRCKRCNQPVCYHKGVITCDGGKWEDDRTFYCVYCDEKNKK